MKGRQMAFPNPRLQIVYGDSVNTFDRDVILCPNVRVENLEEGAPYPTTLFPPSQFGLAGGRDEAIAVHWPGRNLEPEPTLSRQTPKPIIQS